MPSTKPKGWVLGSDARPTLTRFSGKAWPHIEYMPHTKQIVARNDNGPHPSQSVSTSLLTLSGLKHDILPHISKPWPTEADLVEFVKRVENS